MNLRKHITGIFSCIGILILIIDGETALTGAAAGINLCIKTVIPSLFPFLFLCSLLTCSLWGIDTRWLKRVGKKLGIPQGAESILIAAVLGGYPAGAQIIGTAFQNGNIEKDDACHLLTFCSNAGPAFLLGMASAMFPDHTIVWALWQIQILAAAMTGISGQYIPKNPAVLSSTDLTISDHLLRTIRVMASICGWVLLFRILIAFLDKWILFYFPDEFKVLINGILELSNGCVLLNLLDSIPLRFIMCSAFLSFGGLCVTMQTISVIGSLSIVSYLSGKLRQVCFSVFLCILYLQLGWISFLICVIILWFLPVRIKNKSGFPTLQGV